MSAASLTADGPSLRQQSTARLCKAAHRTVTDSTGYSGSRVGDQRARTNVAISPSHRSKKAITAHPRITHPSLSVSLSLHSSVLSLPTLPGLHLCVQYIQCACCIEGKFLLGQLAEYLSKTTGCRRPPLIHFNLSFGSALGGGASAGLVRTWLDPFLRETLTSLLVWPNRIVFPILRAPV